MAARYPWWRAFTVRKKGVQESDESQPGEKPSTTSSKSASDSVNGAFINEGTYDEAEFESVFNEKTCRRNLNISRSGRFKEKRRVRAPIPENKNIYDGNVAVTVVAK